MKRNFLKKMLSGFLILSVVSGQMTAITPAFAQSKLSVTKAIHSGGSDFSADAASSGRSLRTRSAKKPILSAAEKKISTDLLKLSDDSFLSSGETRADVVARMKSLKQYVGKADANRPNMRNRSADRGDLVYAYVRLETGADTGDIGSSVWEVAGWDAGSRLAVAYVETDKLQALAALPEVVSIDAVTPPRVRKGSVTAEGDIVQKTASVRSTFSQDGTGIKIGVISDGVENLSSAKSSGDLPSNVTVIGGGGYGDEGTSMLEIVHDMAPGASLYYHDCGDTMVSFNAAVDALVSAGCKIIIDDIGWDEESFFDDGVVGSHMASVMSSNDVVFVSAAGNEADAHYQGTYDNDGYGYQDFSHGTANEDNNCLYVDLPAGAELDVALQWDDEFGQSDNDYDLQFYDYDTGNKLAESVETQDGHGDPLETIYYTNRSYRNIRVEIDAMNYNAASGEGPAADTKTLELYIYTYDGTISSKNIVAADSIYGHPAVKGVLAVGAVSAQDPGYDTIEYYSSRGPSTITGETPRNKPDIVALDNVAVSGAGDFDSVFSGTSASAPAIGAMIAQLWGAFPTMKGTAIRDAVVNSAVDLGTSGFDYSFGYGRADALLAYQKLDSSVAKSSAKAITSFTLANQAGVINESGHTITVSVPSGTGLASLAPTISVSAGATVSPASGASRSFSSPVIYTVTAQDGSSQSYVVTATVNADRDTVAPVIALSGSSSISLKTGESYSEPGATARDNVDGNVNVIISGSVNTGVAGDYTIVYTAVDAAGNIATSSRIVHVIAPANTSSGDAITSFSFAALGVSGIIDETNHKIILTVPYGTNVTSLVPTIIVSGGAGVSPRSGVAQNFSISKTYTVTSSAGNSQDYIVTVKIDASGDDTVTSKDSDLVINATQKGVVIKTLANANQVQAEIPKGSVTSDTTFTISQKTLSANDAPNVTGAKLFAGLAFNIAGVDTNNNPVSLGNMMTITLTVPELAGNASGLGVYYYNETSKSWFPVTGVTFGTGTITFLADRVATYAVFQVQSQTQTRPAIPAGIVDGDIIQCKNSANPFAVYIVKIVGSNAYIRHIVSLQIFNYYKHLKWENLKQVDSLSPYSLSGWVRVNTGVNGAPRAEDKVWEINGDQTRHWINMTAQQFLTHGGSDEAIYVINQGELNLYAIGPDVMSL